MMRKYINLFILTGTLFLSACDGTDFEVNSQIPERFHKILYLDTYGKQTQMLYDTDEPNRYMLSLIKAGSENTATAGADIIVSSQEEIEMDYNQLEGVNYKVISEDCYTIEPKHIELEAEDEYKQITVLIKAEAVKSCIDSDPSAHWVLPLRVVSETDSINANRNFLFLQLPEVITPSVGFINTNPTMINYTYGRVPTIEQNIPFSLDTENLWNIDCGFTIDKSYVDDYNTQNNANYTLVPTDKVTYSENVTLPTGANSMNNTVSIESGELIPGDYMLPIRISSVSQFKISANDLYPLAFRIIGREIDRTDWSIEATSEELTGESNGANGHAVHAIDGNAGTFWHSKWSSGKDPLPHSLTIDTKSEHTFTQIGLMRRENVNYVKGGYFEISTDKTNWKKVGEFQMKNENGNQVFSIEHTKGRYFKITIDQSNNDNNACLAEIYAYSLE